MTGEAYGGDLGGWRKPGQTLRCHPNEERWTSLIQGQTRPKRAAAGDDSSDTLVGVSCMNNAFNKDNPRSEVMRSHLIQLSRNGKNLKNEREWRPAWSSYTLEVAVNLMLAEPGASHSMILRAAWELLGSSKAPLDREIANFVSDLVQTCLRLDRRRYLQEGREWIRQEIIQSATPAQAYLALRSLPESELILVGREIVAILNGTDFLEEASQALAAASSEDEGYSR